MDSNTTVGTVTGENNTPAAGEQTAEKTQGVQAPGEQARKGGDQPPQGEAPQKATQKTQETEAQRRARFDALIGEGGEFADFYRQDTQRAVQGRLAKVKGALEAQQPLIDLLATRYNTQDVGQIRERLEKDVGWLQTYADERGISEEQAREQLALRAENEALKRQHAQQEGERRADRQMQVWAQQVQEAKQVYPDFDVNAAMRDPQFVSLIRGQVPMKTAWEVLHMEDIKRATADQAAKEAEARLAADIQANGARPVEGGASGQMGASVRVDPSKMTKAERQAIAQRAMRGENITFA